MIYCQNPYPYDAQWNLDLIKKEEITHRLLFILGEPGPGLLVLVFECEFGRVLHQLLTS